MSLQATGWRMNRGSQPSCPEPLFSRRMILVIPRRPTFPKNRLSYGRVIPVFHQYFSFVLFSVPSGVRLPSLVLRLRTSSRCSSLAGGCLAVLLMGFDFFLVGEMSFVVLLRSFWFVLCGWFEFLVCVCSLPCEQIKSPPFQETRLSISFGIFVLLTALSSRVFSPL